MKTFIKGFDARKSLGPLKRLCLLRGQGKAIKRKNYREGYDERKNLSGIKYSNTLQMII